MRIYMLTQRDITLLSLPMFYSIQKSTDQIEIQSKDSLQFWSVHYDSIKELYILRHKHKIGYKYHIHAKSRDTLPLLLEIIQHEQYLHRIKEII